MTEVVTAARPFERSHYDAIVIGGGIGGMNCAFHLVRGGKRVLVLEKNARPMGSAWAKTTKGYAFEETIHFMGSMDAEGPSGRFIAALREHAEIETVFLERLYRLVGPGFDIPITSDVEAFRQALLDIAPEDAAFIHRFVDTTHHFARNLRWPRHPLRWMGVRERIEMVWPLRGHLLELLGFRNTGFHEGVTRWIRNPLLQNVIYTTLHGSDISFLAALAIVGTAFTESGGLPVRGVHHMFETLERVIVELGGEVHKRARVDRILTRADRAVGVRLDDGREITADAVVSAIDRSLTYTRLLDDHPAATTERRRFDRFPIGYSFNTVCVGASIPTSMDEIGAHHVRLNEQERPLHDREQREEDRVLSIRFGHFSNPDAAPPGHSALVLSTIAHHDEWSRFLRDDGTYRSEAYVRRKKEIADLMIRRAEAIIPGLSDAVEHWDMSTPLTIEKWTGATRGVGSGGYYAVPSMVSRFLSEESRIRGLYFAGQFATGRQGINGSLQSGLNTAALILDDRSIL